MPISERDGALFWAPAPPRAPPQLLGAHQERGTDLPRVSSWGPPGAREPPAT